MLRHQIFPFRKYSNCFGSKDYIGHRRRTLANTSNNTINSYTLHMQTMQKSYFYDIAIVSMSPVWFTYFTSPREIYCHSTNTSILVRKAIDDEDIITRADILIFSTQFNRVYNWTKFQRLRHSEQLWVYTTEESPFTSLKMYPPVNMNIHFNLSYTYHREADISVPYGQFIPFNLEKQVSDVTSYFHKKTKLIVWVSSHCSFTQMWRRSDFAYDLAKYLPLDMYGSCGNLDCPRKEFSKCVKMFKTYKFYLSIENSCCEGYITEKFWTALTHLETIPVVVGAPKKDYEQIVPKKSFIHADDFGSMKELAEYILKVSKSDEMYNSYFEWKRLGETTMNQIYHILAFNDPGVCKLIEYVKSSSAASLAATSFDPYGPNWFSGCNKCSEQMWLRNYSNLNYDLIMKRLTARI
ncbi:Glycoprotein 3-alpha-L-fucosyltransferase A [Holothuria leucospilota]|uniref:Fucosyltransferase n=1 Tax=Holothuria leucospilota TaxID=206669 RepID=A0A9Q1BWB3_HOLLE|nr:Glycoprotein 3-alpha-L-fucosyltransferase A [Holothuria leucospilota]